MNSMEIFSFTFFCKYWGAKPWNSCHEKLKQYSLRIFAMLGTKLMKLLEKGVKQIYIIKSGTPKVEFYTGKLNAL